MYTYKGPIYTGLDGQSWTLQKSRMRLIGVKWGSEHADKPQFHASWCMDVSDYTTIFLLILTENIFKQAWENPFSFVTVGKLECN